MSTIPTDTLFAQQWHLNNTVTGEFDLDVISVWDDYTGKGVRVAVMDSGTDYLHPDLAPNYDTSTDYDFGQGDDDPYPPSNHIDEAHGTAVAGIIGAAANGTGVVGVAYESTLVGYRIQYRSAGDKWTSDLVNTFENVVTNDIDVVNMSFGAFEFFHSYFTIDQVNQQLDALSLMVDYGRDGLGAILVKSAGNSRGDQFNLNSAEVGNETRQIIVAAVDRDGYVSSYSTYGAPILISGFGTPGEVYTTDRLGSAGYRSGDFMEGFNGTSAAAPMVSGVVALMLEANSGLGWRDVQTILSLTARHVGSAVDGDTKTRSEAFTWNFNTATNWNGGGLHYSEDYGYGLVDAHDAVRLAETWLVKPATSANEESIAVNLLNETVTAPDGDLDGLTFTKRAGAGVVVERVVVSMDFSVGNTTDLDVYLIGPDGREQLLVSDTGLGYGYDDAQTGPMTFQSQAFRGADSQGSWSIKVVDDAIGGETTVSNVSITLFGAAASKNDTYVYTNEFSDFLDTHSTTLKDTDGGTDTLNAAAVTTAISINLAKGTGKIDGVAVRVSGVENAYAGDGDDTIVGSKGSNDLSGGRGADILSGGKGADDFLFFSVRDSRDLENHDLIKDFGKGDDIDLSRLDAVRDEFDINNAFSFIKGAAFGEVAGQLRFEFLNPHGKKHDFTFVTADIDGDAAADFMIALSGLHKLKVTDFIL